MREPANQPPGPLSQFHLIRSASIITLGNIVSRLLGFVRDTLMAGTFGAGAHVDGLNLALAIPIQIYELTTGGLVNSALVPVFSEYTTVEGRTQLWRLVSTLLTLASVLLSLFAAALMSFAPQLIALLASLGQVTDPTTQFYATQLLRLTLPAVIFLGLAGILSSLMYSLQRFAVPAFAAAIFNAGTIFFLLTFAKQFNVQAMAAGFTVGAIGQMVWLVFGLRGVHLRFAFSRHPPGLRRIVQLYRPILFGLITTQISVYIGLGLALRFTGGLSWMRYATTLYQFPLGLVATAISGAVLPTLARQASYSLDEFKTTFVAGVELIMLLIMPATFALFVLARPLVALAFERGAFTAQDTDMTAQVLQLFLIGLSFAAVDQLLVFAFYARQDTLTPTLVGILSVGVYIAVAFFGLRSLGLFSLMLADSLKQITHALISGAILSHRLGGFRPTTLWVTFGKVFIASALMAVAMEATLIKIQSIDLASGALHRLLAVAAPSAMGAIVYVAVVWTWNVRAIRPALDTYWHKSRSKLDHGV